VTLERKNAFGAKTRFTITAVLVKSGATQSALKMELILDELVRIREKHGRLGGKKCVVVEAPKKKKSRRR
jgi:hypothetical protein